MAGRALPAIVWGGLAVVLGVAIGAGIVRSARSPGSPAGDFGTVPAFSLIDSDGMRVDRSRFAGEWWVADFIFTRCTGICPILTSRMARIAAEIPDVTLVSFSVDPLYDTPDVLSRHAEGVRPLPASRGRWHFLTGPRDELYRLIGEGFHLSVAEAGPGVAPPEGELITHSDRIVIVDPEGRIRGYHHGTDEDAVERIAADLARLRGGT